MRLILGIVCLMLGVGLMSCRVEGPSGKNDPKTQVEVQTQAGRWVRTVDGWERAGNWTVGEVQPPRLHPLVVAAGQGLLSLLGLAACQRGAKPQADC